MIKIRFSEKDCSQCPSVTRCVRSSKKYPRRLITVRQQAADEALRPARQQEKTRAFAELYANRSGVEGTISQGVRTCRMRRTRYRGFGQDALGSCADRAAVTISRDGPGSTLAAWDVEQESLSDHDRRHAVVHEYVVTGNTADERKRNH